jgi:hypothetical protein
MRKAASDTMPNPRTGQRLTLACSCEAVVAVPMILMMPKHFVVRVVARGKKCDLGHARGRRVVVRGQNYLCNVT